MRRIFVSASLFVVTTVSGPSFVNGQQSQNQNTVQLPPVVVEAERKTEERTYSEKKARQEIQRTPGGVALIGSQEIKESRATALQDVLDFVPGVMIRPRFGNVADESQISIRGSGLRNNFHLRELTFLIDGFPITNADGFGDFEALELLAAKRLEVYKGANALRFGVNSLGGAINLVSKIGEDSGLRSRKTYQFTNGQWFTGQEFHTETFYAVDGFLTQEKPEYVNEVINLAGGFVIPPFGEAHNHNVEGPWNIESIIQTYLNAGVFYVKNPNNIADFSDQIRDKINIPTSVDAVFANGGLTASGGHPIGLYEHGLRKIL